MAQPSSEVLVSPDPCVCCGSTTRAWSSDLRHLKAVTSDCQPWPTGSEVFVCGSCYHTQKNLDARWRDDASHIYRRYYANYSGKRSEQVVFDTQTLRAPQTRSMRLLARFKEHIEVPECGTMLEVGCGNGTFLRSFSETFPDWSLVAQEPNESFQGEVLSIPGVRNFHSLPLETITERFDLVVLMHTLEHVEQPLAMLREIRALLAPHGKILIEIPSLLDNPFDLLVRDHVSHFTPHALATLAQRAGIPSSVITREWIPGELSGVLGLTDELTSDGGRELAGGEEVVRYLAQSIARLEHMVREVAGLAQDYPLGIFGTAVAATWLGSILGEKCSYYVDEDPARWGTHCDGKPIIAPTSIPAASCVYCPMPTTRAQAICARLSGLFPHVRFVYPEGIS